MSVPSCSATSATTRALAVAVVASTGTPGAQAGQSVAEPTVVGPEVVPPVGDAVRLVDDQQAEPRGEPGQHVVTEVRVVEPLRADQQDVDLAGAQLVLDTSSHSSRLAELIVRALMPARAAASTWLRISASSGETITRGTGAARPQQHRRDEVHRGLAPAGALHHQSPPPLRDEHVDCLPLVVTQDRVG